MIDHDAVVGQLLDLVDKMGLAENTIVQYSTDNGPHMNTWPDAGMTPFRCEKNSNCERQQQQHIRTAAARGAVGCWWVSNGAGTSGADKR